MYRLQKFNKIIDFELITAKKVNFHIVIYNKLYNFASDNSSLIRRDLPKTSKISTKFKKQ